MTDQPKDKIEQSADSESSPRGNGSNDKKPPPPPTVKLGRGLMSWVMILALLIMLFVVLNNTQGRGKEIPTWQEFTKFIERGDVLDDSIIIRDDRIMANVEPDAVGFPPSTEPTPIWVRIDAANREWFLNQLDAAGASFNFDTGTSVWVSLLVALAPFILLILLVWFLIARSMRSAGAGPGGMLGSFGKSRHRLSNKESVTVAFSDVAGVDEAKEEVEEIVEFLKNPKRFQRLGGRIPRGVLLVGPPGCGKTLLAKAIAGQAEVPFFSISGSDFVEMFVGVGASRVRDLFKQAKDNSPCIIFLDEIDAVGRRRGGGFTTGGHDEREQTLNAILVEMDGFEANDQIIVVAATNRSDILDPALTRPGRFDRQVMVPLPDLIGRQQILKVHSKNVTMGPDVDLERLARGTPMFSGADLAAIVNEAAIMATLTNKPAVEMADLEEARDKVRFGRARKSSRIEEEERIATAFHEAGHAVCQAVLEHADPLHKVTITPRGQSLGATFALPEKDRHGYGGRYLHHTLRVLCAGRIAELRKTGDISSGAAMDIQQATQFARHMILEWGMSERLGFVYYSGTDTREAFIPEREYSDETARIIDQEIKRFIDEAYAEAQDVIDERWEAVTAIAEALLKYETLQCEEVEKLLRGEKLDKPTVAELLEQEAAKTAPPPPKPEPAADKGQKHATGGDALPSPA